MKSFNLKFTQSSIYLSVALTFQHSSNWDDMKTVHNIWLDYTGQLHICFVVCHSAHQLSLDSDCQTQCLLPNISFHCLRFKVCQYYCVCCASLVAHWSTEPSKECQSKWPTVTTVRLRLGICYNQRKRAYSYMETGIEIAPQDSRVWSNVSFGSLLWTFDINRKWTGRPLLKTWCSMLKSYKLNILVSFAFRRFFVNLFSYWCNCIKTYYSRC